MHVLLSAVQFSELYDYLASEPTCDHTLRYTLDWMKEHHIQDIQVNIEKIVDLGGHCDCEVLLNVDPDTWEERREEGITGSDAIGESEWRQFIADLLYDSGYDESEEA